MFVVLTIGLIAVVYGALALVDPVLPAGVRGFLRNPGSPWPIFVACVFTAMAVVKTWSRSRPRPVDHVRRHPPEE